MKQLPLLCLALLCLLFTNCKKEVSPIEPEVDPKITTFKDSLTALYNASVIPGFAVTVVKDGIIHYQEAFGQANVEQDIQYTNQTNQPIGSISKTFIGVALMKAIEQGHFTLETPINEILPFEVINPNVPPIPLIPEPIRVKHLITHTSSFEDSFENYELEYFIKKGENVLLPSSKIILELGVQVSEAKPLGEYLKAVYTEEGALYDADNFLEEGPGKIYAYSNITASLAAYLIEAKTGKPYADYVREYIFDPLNMKNTGYDRSTLDQSKLATLYLSKAYPFPEISHSSYPDGFINTSNEALSNFLVEMMKGATGTGTLLSKENYQTLFERQSPEDLVDGEIHSVFWDLVDGRIEHSGGDPGVVAFLSFDPIVNTGYLLMANFNDLGLGQELGVDGQIAFDQFLEILDMVQEFERE